METTGTPGRIQVSARTRELVADGFVWEEGGVVEFKGRGPVETWYLLGRSNQPPRFHNHLNDTGDLIQEAESRRG
jgi:class 3 adenylate cyclase